MHSETKELITLLL